MERVVREMEAAPSLGKEAEALIDPLFVLVQSTIRAGHLADSYTIMLRALNISEAHHGEEGMRTCMLRSELGEAAEF